MEELIEKCKEAVKRFRECGITDELVLVVPYMSYMGYSDRTWERVKEKTGVDHVERSEIGFPHDVEAMVVQRSEYLRMFIKSLDEKESESNGDFERKDN